MSRYVHYEIDALKGTMVALGAVVEDRIAQTIAALMRRDVDLARDIAEGDTDINDMEVDIEGECLRLLALYQPVAIDLCLVVAVLKINSDLERMADLVALMARRVVNLATVQSVLLPSRLEDMASATHAMVQQSLQAFEQEDTALAQHVRDTDSAIDAHSRSLYELLCHQIHAGPESHASVMNLLMVTQHLERIAAHATHIAEDVIYLVEGTIVRHQSAASNASTSRG